MSRWGRNPTVQSTDRIAVTLVIANDTPTGPRRVVVTNPDKTAASCGDCLVISDRPILH